VRSRRVSGSLISTNHPPQTNRPNGHLVDKECRSMKPTQTRIGTLWCRVMHAEPMWPAHGQYECRRCGRRHPVCWQEPSPATSRARVLPYETLPSGALVTATKPGIQYL
jgi:hypothetical protein